MKLLVLKTSFFPLVDPISADVHESLVSLLSIALVSAEVAKGESVPGGNLQLSSRIE